MAKPKNTLVTFLLDRSQSMETIRDRTIEAFNEYTAEMKSAPNILFSLLQFDSISLDTVFKNQPIAQVPGLSRETFQPRGSTPLIDACVKTIRALDSALKTRKDVDKVVVCFQTDGQENVSREHTWGELNDLIKEKTKAGWQFNFMGAGIDSYAQASLMGLSSAQTVSYDSASEEKTSAAFRSRGAATAMYASGARHDVSFSAGDKLAAGDKFDPDKKAPKTSKAIVDEPQL